MLAELVEGAGLDFRVVVLTRQPLPILTSTTVHRNFGAILPQAATLMANEAVLLTQLLQLNPQFAMCIDYNNFVVTEKADYATKDISWEGELRSFLGLTPLSRRTQAAPQRRLGSTFFNTSDESTDDHEQRYLTTKRGGVASGWKRSVGEAFDPVVAAPLLELFNSLDDMFRKNVCGRAVYSSAASLSRRQPASRRASRRLAASSKEICKYVAWKQAYDCESSPQAPSEGSKASTVSSSKKKKRVNPSSSTRRPNLEHRPLTYVEKKEREERMKQDLFQPSPAQSSPRHFDWTAASEDKFKGREIVDIVVAHYSYSMEWLDTLLETLVHSFHVRVFVYLKGVGAAQEDGERAAHSNWETLHGLRAMVNITYPAVYFHRLPNVGREGHTYLHHIMRLYGVDGEAAGSSMPLSSEVDEAYLKAVMNGGESVPRRRVICFLKDSSAKEGGFDISQHAKWKSSLKLVKMVRI